MPTLGIFPLFLSGRVLNLSDAQTLGVALDKAIAGLRQGYTLGFTPLRSGAAGSFHRLTVKLVTGQLSRVHDSGTQRLLRAKACTLNDGKYRRPERSCLLNLTERRRGGTDCGQWLDLRLPGVGLQEPAMATMSRQNLWLWDTIRSI
jgi:hypothetical protein